MNFLSVCCIASCRPHWKRKLRRRGSFADEIGLEINWNVYNSVQLVSSGVTVKKLIAKKRPFGGRYTWRSWNRRAPSITRPSWGVAFECRQTNAKKCAMCAAGISVFPIHTRTTCMGLVSVVYESFSSTL